MTLQDKIHKVATWIAFDTSTDKELYGEIKWLLAKMYTHPWYVENEPNKIDDDYDAVLYGKNKTHKKESK